MPTTITRRFAGDRKGIVLTSLENRPADDAHEEARTARREWNRRLDAGELPHAVRAVGTRVVAYEGE